MDEQEVNFCVCMDEQEVNCCICMEPFDEDDHTPRTLKCGHTLCSFCIESLLQRCVNDRNCPECRKPLKITNVSHLPVSYTVLRLSHVLSDVKYKLLNEVLGDGDVCLKHGFLINSWCKECDMWLCRRCKCREMCSDAMPYSDALLHLKRELVAETNLVIFDLLQKKEFYEEMKHSLELQISELKGKLEGVAEKLRKIEIGIASVQEDEAQVIEVNSVKRIERSIKQSKKHISELQNFMEENSRESTPEVPLSTPVDLQDLKERLQITQSMYAVHTKVDGSMRWSKLTIHGMNLLLHASEETPPPCDATLVTFDGVMQAMDPVRQMAFIDLSVDYRHEGRICIDLFRGTLRSENFIRFCLGNHGPCYKGLEIEKLVIEDGGKEYIQSIQSGNFKDMGYCTALVDGITVGGYYQRNCHPGLVFGSVEPERMSMFGISVGYMSGGITNAAFGKVTSGVLVLRSTLYEMKTESKIAHVGDCGIMIPLRK